MRVEKDGTMVHDLLHEEGVAVGAVTKVDANNGRRFVLTLVRQKIGLNMEQRMCYQRQRSLDDQEEYKFGVR